MSIVVTSMFTLAGKKDFVFVRWFSAETCLVSPSVYVYNCSFRVRLVGEKVWVWIL